MAKNYFIIFATAFSFLFVGCAEKEIKVVPKYIKVPCKYPKLKVYPDNSNLALSIKPKNGKVCVKEWNACIPEKEFMKLVRYIKEKRAIIKKYQKEIETYNKTYIKEK